MLNLLSCYHDIIGMVNVLYSVKFALHTTFRPWPSYYRLCIVNRSRTCFTLLLGVAEDGRRPGALMQEEILACFFCFCFCFFVIRSCEVMEGTRKRIF